MPKRSTTENQFARLIGATAIQIELSLIRMSEHKPRNTGAEHMAEFYRPFSEVKATDEKFDGFIITGAPIEHLPFTDVTYWEELCEVLNGQKPRAFDLRVCWGGMAMINYSTASRNTCSTPRHWCFDIATWTDVALPARFRMIASSCKPLDRDEQDEIDAIPDLKTLLSSDAVGPCLIQDQSQRALYIFNHFEYDSDTLKQEYDRDVAEGRAINVPVNYYPDDDPTKPPLNRWRSHAHLLYGNWITEIYETTPYDMTEIGH